MDYQGVWTAIVTPFTEDGSAVDFDRLEINLGDQAAAGVTGVVPCGTTGETPTLSASEHIQIIERTIAAARPHGMLVAAGAGSNNTAHAVALHRAAHAAGADAALHVTPYYNRPSPEGLYRHYMAIADSCDLPIILYNVPGRTGVRLEMPTLVRLAQHPHIQAVKDATGGLDLATRVVAETSLVVLSGDDPLTLPMAAVGASGVISVASNLVPERIVAMCRAFLEGDWGGARTLNAELTALNHALLTLDSNPVPVKTAMHLLGRDTAAVRLPLCPASSETVATLQSVLATYDLRVAVTT